MCFSKSKKAAVITAVLIILTLCTVSIFAATEVYDKSDMNTESNSKETEMTVEDIAKTEEEIISEEMDIISSKPQSDISTATDIFDKTDVNTWFSSQNGTKVTAEDIDKIVKGMTLEDVVNLIGKPLRDIGSGVSIFEWNMVSGDRLDVYFINPIPSTSEEIENWKSTDLIVSYYTVNEGK